MTSIKRQADKFLKTHLDDIINRPVPPSLDLEYAFNVVVPAEERDHMTYAKLAAYQLVLKACSGETKSLQELFDRLDGKPTQTTENLNLNMNYVDFLDQCISEDEMIPANTIDAPAIPPTSASDTLETVPRETSDDDDLLAELGLD